jgi:hypothetical protein
MLRGVYPERKMKGILLPRLRDQNDKRRAQHDIIDFFSNLLKQPSAACSFSLRASINAASTSLYRNLCSAPVSFTFYPLRISRPRIGKAIVMKNTIPSSQFSHFFPG